jgi:hypothetical protein
MYQTFIEKEKGLSASDSTDASTGGDTRGAFGDSSVEIQVPPLTMLAELEFL